MKRVNKCKSLKGLVVKAFTTWMLCYREHEMHVPGHFPSVRFSIKADSLVPLSTCNIHFSFRIVTVGKRGQWMRKKMHYWS